MQLGICQGPVIKDSSGCIMMHHLAIAVMGTLTGKSRGSKLWSRFACKSFMHTAQDIAL